MKECVTPDYEGGVTTGQHRYDKEGFCIFCGNRPPPSPVEVCPECVAAEKAAWAMFSDFGSKRGGPTSAPTKCEKHRVPPAPDEHQTYQSMFTDTNVGDD